MRRVWARLPRARGQGADGARKSPRAAKPSTRAGALWTEDTRPPPHHASRATPASRCSGRGRPPPPRAARTLLSGSRVISEGRKRLVSSHLMVAFLPTPHSHLENLKFSLGSFGQPQFAVAVPRMGCAARPVPRGVPAGAGARSAVEARRGLLVDSGHDDTRRARQLQWLILEHVGDSQTATFIKSAAVGRRGHRSSSGHPRVDRGALGAAPAAAPWRAASTASARAGSTIPTVPHSGAARDGLALQAPRQLVEFRHQHRK